MLDPLVSPGAYEAFIYALPDRYTSIRRSTLVYIASGSLFGRVEGRIFFTGDIVLCVQEFLNFELNVIEGYGYEVSRSHDLLERQRAPATDEYCRASYPNKEKLYWYDSFPHPNDPSLARTDPHHKHIPPDTKRHRVPAPGYELHPPQSAFLNNRGDHPAGFA